MLLAVLKQGVVPKRLIKQRLHQLGAARSTPNQSFLLKLRQVAPHACRRSMKSRHQFRKRDAPLCLSSRRISLTRLSVRIFEPLRFSERIFSSTVRTQVYIKASVLGPPVKAVNQISD